MPSTVNGNGQSSWTLTFDPWITPACRSRKSTRMERPVVRRRTPGVPKVDTGDTVCALASAVLVLTAVVWKGRFGYDESPVVVDSPCDGLSHQICATGLYASNAINLVEHEEDLFVVERPVR